MMVMSQRDTNISSNIRAIIKQLNLNPIERKNLLNIERENKLNGGKINNHVTKINIGVYGYNSDYNDDHVQIKTVRSSTTRQRLVVKQTITTSVYTPDHAEDNISQPEEDLPELRGGDRLSHNAAMHRITVRPKNRRPPKRSSAQIGPSVNIPTISEGFDDLDSLETVADTPNDSPVESRNVTVIRKSSSRMTKTSEIFVGELEAKLSSPTAMPRSPGSLDSSLVARPLSIVEADDEIKPNTEIKPVMRKLSNRISKGSDIFAELSSKLPRRRSSINRLSKSPDSLENTWSKSTDSFDRLDEGQEPMRPVLRKSLNLVSKSSKSTDSLDTLNTVNSDDSIERRRSSYEFRNVQRTSRAMSKSSESFEALEETQISEISPDLVDDGLKKGSSASDMVNLNLRSNVNRGMSKSSESVDVDNVDTTQVNSEPKRSSSDLSKRCWRQTKRITVSSESSDNLELDDELENRRARKPPKRIPSTSIVDIIQADNQANHNETDKKPPLIRKPSRFQKSSESSDHGSTDTLDSLEKDLDQDAKEEIMDNDVEKREKNDTWSGQVSEPTTPDMEDTKHLISDKSYWRQSSDAKENIDIHQLLAITIATHMADNGNQRNSVLFPKKKLSSPPTSPAKQDQENKIMFNNLLSSKNDEDLQNMLNGNISEVSTDTKSFKEKLIMFEKLGK